MNRVFDTHDEEPAISLSIGDAGILNLALKPLNLRGYWLIPTLTASIELSKHKRGVHVSRIAKLVLEAFNNESFDYEVVDNLAEKLLETHSETCRSKVVFKAKIAGSENNLFIAYRVVARRGGIDRRASEAGATVLNACPCALNVSTSICGKPYTHMQKTRIRAVLFTKSFIDPLEMGLTIVKSFTSMRNVLNRYEEYRLIAELYDKPLFNEDIVRLTTKALYEAFRDKLSGGDRIKVSAVSFETLHTYRIYSRLSRRIHELDEELVNNKNPRDR